jgi:hypothetical protein
MSRAFGRWGRWLSIGVAAFGIGFGAAAQTARPAAPAASIAPPAPTTDSLAGAASAVQSLDASRHRGAAPARGEGRVTAMNRQVVTLRASALGWPAAERAKVATARIHDMLDDSDRIEVGVEDRPEGTMVLVDGRMLFAVLADDTVERTLEAARADARQAAAVLQLIVDESRESRDLSRMLRAGAVALAATLVKPLTGRHVKPREHYFVGPRLPPMV